MTNDKKAKQKCRNSPQGGVEKHAGQATAQGGVKFPDMPAWQQPAILQIITQLFLFLPVLKRCLSTIRTEQAEAMNLAA